MIIRFYQGWFQMLYIDLPLFLASTFSISSFYLVSQRELFPKTWPRALLYLPFLMALGIGLTITNTRAVLEALVGKKSAFARTPKYRVESKADQINAAKYRRRLGWVPWVELLIGTYFALTVYYAIANENYITVPFLVLFVVGYWYTGLMSLLQGRFSGLSLGARDPHQAVPCGRVAIGPGSGSRSLRMPHPVAVLIGLDRVMQSSGSCPKILCGPPGSA